MSNCSNTINHSLIGPGAIDTNSIGDNIVIPSNKTSTLNVDTLNLFDAYMATATGDKSLYKYAIDKINSITIDDINVSTDEFSISERDKLIAKVSTSIVTGLTGSAMNVAQKTIQNQLNKELKYENIIAETNSIIAQAKKLYVENQYAKEYGNISIQNAEASMESAVASCRMITNDNTIRYTSNNIDTILDYETDITNYAYSDSQLNYTSATYSRENELIKAYNAEMDRKSSIVKSKYIQMKSNKENGYGSAYENGVKSSVTGSFDSTSFGTLGTNYLREYNTHGYWSEDEAVGGTRHGLTYWQTKVQEETYNSFDYNMWQHAANASSNMVATAAAAEGWDNVAEVTSIFDEIIRTKLMTTS